MGILPEQKIRLYHGLKIALIVFLAVFVVNALFDDRGYRDGNKTPNIIAFSGHGEVQAVPDLANIYFSISEDGKTVKDAQAGVAEIEKKALDLLKAKGVADKDIKTANASFYPKYEYRKIICPPLPLGMGITVNPNLPDYCTSNKQMLVGYTASESLTVKIRNTDSVGDIMQGLGMTGVSDLSGPNFAIDKEDALKAQARKLAIDDAKQKAKVLAKDLGVRLVKIVSFSESGNFPIYATKSAMMDSGGGIESLPATIPKGENTISSDVTITYEIR